MTESDKTLNMEEMMKLPVTDKSKSHNFVKGVARQFHRFLRNHELSKTSF
jgi:hypothetical protein